MLVLSYWFGLRASRYAFGKDLPVVHLKDKPSGDERRAVIRAACKAADAAGIRYHHYHLSLVHGLAVGQIEDGGEPAVEL